MDSKKRIGIIGAGASGAAACKACLEEGFDVIVFEQTNYTMGLWRYHEDDVEGVASVSKSTIISSSKEMSAFSDFPPPDGFPNLMHNTKMLEYLEMYGRKFEFEKFVRFRNRIIKLEMNVDYVETGKWKITALDMNKNLINEEIFDGVMICTGHHVHPRMPEFKDQNKFLGKILHTHSYKKPEQYNEKVVVVVGIGNSGGDAAVDLAPFAKKIYLSTRRGVWVLPRMGLNGKPIDSWLLTRMKNIIASWIPFRLRCFIIESYVNTIFNHNKFQLRPNHRILSQHGFVNDYIFNLSISGTLVVKQNIEQFTAKGVIFEGEIEETSCDIILLATGYKIKFPFISDNLIPVRENRIDLYKHVFWPYLKHPETLAFITLVQTQGALLPAGEQQSRWFAQLMSCKVKLPNRDVMIKDILNKRKVMENKFYPSERHSIEEDWLPYMDEITKQFGAKPNLFKYFFTDNKLWRALMFGPCVPYQYRLDGPHRWTGARNSILTVENRIAVPLMTRKNI